MATAIVDDLLDVCPVTARAAEQGSTVFDLNFDLHVKTATWNVDLVLGRPGTTQVPADAKITRGPPATVAIAIELKSVMTEHRKAVKNRKRDLEAHHEHVHNYNSRAIAGGVFVINRAGLFRSPLRGRSDITPHGRDERSLSELVSHCVSEMRNVSERNDAAGTGLDAKCVIVIDMDNIDLSTTRFETNAPAPREGDPLHYDSFLQRICDQYEQRYS